MSSSLTVPAIFSRRPRQVACPRRSISRLLRTEVTRPRAAAIGFAVIAQLAERRLCNADVRGSRPRGGSSFVFGGVAQLGERLLCKQNVVGSIPSTSTMFRGIAQPGSAPALGAGCREFESLYPDQKSPSWRWSHAHGDGTSTGDLWRWQAVLLRVFLAREMAFATLQTEHLFAG